MARRRVLVVSPLLPYPFDLGCKVRIYHLVRILAREHTVTLAALAHSRDTEGALRALRGICDRVLCVLAPNRRSLWGKGSTKARYWAAALARGTAKEAFYATPAPFAQAIAEETRARPPDVVQCEYWYTRGALRQAVAPWVAVDTHDVQFQRDREVVARGRPAGPLLRRWLRARRSAELEALRGSQLVIALTEGDRQTFREALGPAARIEVIPTGVDTDYFSPGPGPREPATLLFLGALGVPPNAEAALEIARTYFPAVAREVEGARLWIVGSHPPPAVRALAGDPRITVTGFVEDLRPYLQRATLLLCPLRRASGIRGRLFEGLSTGLPAVVTPEAVSGMGLGEEAGIVASPAGDPMVRAIVSLLRGTGRREELGRLGREHMAKHLSLEATYGALRDLYSTV